MIEKPECVCVGGGCEVGALASGKEGFMREWEGEENMRSHMENPRQTTIRTAAGRRQQAWEHALEQGNTRAGMHLHRDQCIGHTGVNT